METFNPILRGRDAEAGGPISKPTLLARLDPKRPTHHIPNWFREFQFRETLPWLESEPTIWSRVKPEWSHVITMTYTWDGTGNRNGTFGNYSIANGNQAVQTGVMPFPKPD